MARPKTKIDKDEINEIINLYIKKVLNGNTMKLSANGITKFSAQIAKNETYIRQNGLLFNKYKYTIWAGNYQGNDYYGKQRINEIKNEAEVKGVGEAFNPVTLDIIRLLEDSKNVDDKLKLRLCKIFDKERKYKNELEKDLENIKRENKKLRQKIDMMEKSIINLMFQSQSPDNSLNDMFNATRSTDVICCREMENIFNEGSERIKILMQEKVLSDDGESKKVINIAEKNKLDKYSEL